MQYPYYGNVKGLPYNVEGVCAFPVKNGRREKSWERVGCVPPIPSTGSNRCVIHSGFRYCKRLASTIFAMETRLKPVVARIPAITFPPQLQQMVDKDKAHFNMILVDPAKTSEISDELVQRVEGLVIYTMEYVPVDAKLIDLFPNLKVISNFGVGVNHIDIAAASERGIAVGHTPGVPDCTADMAFALLMASARNIVEGDRIARNPETKQVNETLTIQSYLFPGNQTYHTRGHAIVAGCCFR